MKIVVKIESLNMICMHPQNDSYPIFSLHADGMSHDMDMKFDHDDHVLKIVNFRLDDNSNYPRTLDPTVIYTEENEMQS